MTHDEAFLQDIIQHHDDDAPRLIYADWLDDHGQPERAEFIRLQIALACLAPDHPQRADLLEREADLLAEHGDRWRAPLRALGVTDAEFRRGFVEEAWVNSPSNAVELPGIFRAAPLRALRLWKCDPDMVAQLARMSEAARLRQLTIRPCHRRHGIGPAGVRALAESPHLSGLTFLCIAGDAIEQDGVRALAFSTQLHSLTELSLHCNDLNDDSAFTLAESPLLPRLRSLGLGWNNLQNEGVAALLAALGAGLERLDLELNNFSGRAVARMIADASHLRLNYLNLGDSNVGPEGAAALASAEHLAGLECLILQHGGLGDEGVRALARSPHLAGLRELWLCSNNLTAAGIAALGESTFWANLRRLSLNDRSIDDAGVQALADSPSLAELSLWYASAGPEGIGSLAHKSFPSLEKLSLAYLPSMGDTGLARLLAGPGLVGLKSLLLNQVGLTAAGAAALADSPRLADLRSLSLVEERIGGEGAGALARSSSVAGLREISLSACGIGDEGACALAESPHLERLLKLSLYRNNIDLSDAGRAKRALRERFGDRVQLG